jgi:hypothetical protein
MHIFKRLKRCLSAAANGLQVIGGAAILLVMRIESVHAEEVVLPAVDGLIVKTKAAVLQQVKLRLKTFGPGFCDVRVVFAGQVQSVVAPPLYWSNWLPIGPAVSGGAYELAFSPQCDTGALGEVKFEK